MVTDTIVVTPPGYDIGRCDPPGLGVKACRGLFPYGLLQISQRDGAQLCHSLDSEAGEYLLRLAAETAQVCYRHGCEEIQNLVGGDHH